AKSVNEDTPYSYTLTFRDIDGDAITKSAKILPKWLTFNTSSGVLSGIPLNNNVGDTVVSLAINDGKVEIVQTYTLTVVNVNDPPVRKSTAPTAVNENVLYSYTFVAEDVDVGDQITLSIQGTLPSWLNFTDNGNGTGLLSGTPNNDAVGYDPFRDYNIVIRATDKAAAYIQESFVIRVTNINDAPVITGQAVVATDEDVPLTITLNHLIVTDVDNVYPTDFTLVVHNGSNYTRVGNTITPALNYSGGLIVPVTISDGDSSKNYNLNVTVNPVNDPPVFTTTPVVTAKENVNYLYIFIATDVDDATLNYAYDKKPEWLTFTSTTSGGSLTGTPGSANVGKDSVVIKVTDSKATTYQRFIIDVENVNDKPAFSSSPVTTGDDYELYSYTLTGTDNDPNDVLSFFGKTLPSWLSIVKQEGVTKLTGTPQHVNVGNNPVVIGLTDSYDTVYQSFTIVVGNINSLPVVESVPELIIKVGNPYAYQLVVTDVDADDVITIAPTTIPSWLTYDAATKILSGLPGAATPSTNDVLFTIGDGRGQITHAFTISVVITGINDYTSSASIIHNLYPVPADKELTVEFNDAQSCTFQVININGRIVKNIEVLNQSRITVDVSDLMPNVYFFKIMKGSEIQVGKIVIE
ncbi:MAG: putative Ig domain-containing protein, partial [Bacteroidales bacterium]